MDRSGSVYLALERETVNLREAFLRYMSLSQSLTFRLLVFYVLG